MRVGAALVALGAAAGLALLVVAPVVAAGEIPLPDPSSVGGRPFNPTDLLGPDRPGEVASHAPGPVTDHELVHAGIGPDGGLRTVTVDQDLVITGVGDFELNLPGPATDVVAPPDQSPQPGLRRASVLYQGFSPGQKELHATVTLEPDVERHRLPLRVAIRPVAGGTEVTIANATAVPISVATGPVDPGSLKTAATAVRSRLELGRDPIAGLAGVPRSVTAAGPPATTALAVPVPFVVRGDVGGSTTVPVDTVLPSAAHPDGRVVVVVGAGAPVRLHLTAIGTRPDPRLVRDDSLVSVDAALAGVLRRPEYDAYLGKTVPGDAVTTYEFTTARRARAPAPRAPREHPHPFAIAVAGVATAALLTSAALVWARL